MSDEVTLTTNLGDLITLARKRKGMTRAALSRITGISANTLAKYEQAGSDIGKYPSLHKMFALCGVLEIDPRWVAEMMRRNGDIETTNVYDFRDYFRENDRMDDGRATRDDMVDSLVSNYALAEEISKLRDEVGSLRADLNKNGPGVNPDRPVKSKNNTEAVGAASTRPKKGKD